MHVSVRRELEGSMTWWSISSTQPSINRTLLKLVGAEYHKRPHQTIRGTSKLQRSAPTISYSCITREYSETPSWSSCTSAQFPTERFHNRVLVSGLGRLPRTFDHYISLCLRRSTCTLPGLQPDSHRVCRHLESLLLYSNRQSCR